MSVVEEKTWRISLEDLYAGKSNKQKTFDGPFWSLYVAEEMAVIKKAVLEGSLNVCQYTFLEIVSTQ